MVSDGRSDWRSRAEAHRARADALLAPHTERQRAGRSHPVFDFLFTYYSLKPRQLRVWHPGYGVALVGPAADRYLERAGYVRQSGGVTVSREHLHARLGTV
ncbi:3-methyladenine DNA glycosylase, partial [Mycobacterium sp. ITM-2017-0098]